MEGTLTRRNGTSVRRLVRVDGERIRVETGTLGEARVEVYDGKDGWQQDPGQEAQPLSPARRDLLAGTRYALLGAQDPEVQKTLSACELSGGEALDGQLVARLEVRDQAGRKRLVYFDGESLELAGLAFPIGEAWVEERWRFAGERLSVTRVEFESGATLETLEGRFEAGPQPKGCFAPEESQ